MEEQRSYPSLRAQTAGGRRLLSLDDFTLEDLESIRLLLRGGSVVDWHQLDFVDYTDVDRFLRINEFDPQSDADMVRLEEIRSDAVEYLTRNLQFRLPEQVASEIMPRDLFLVASRKGRRQLWACVILKVMHIIHHLAGRELLTRLPISSDQIYHVTELKVMRVIEELRAAGHPILEFQWSRKPKDSQITKLLAKRSTLAANIYDKLRFRLIVKDQDSIAPILASLTRQLIPFNYIVPGESVNRLLPFRAVIDSSDNLRKLEPQLQLDKSLERSQDRAAEAPINEFSALEYRIINFVVDLPVRVDEFVKEENRGFGNVVFVMTEFQLADRPTVDRNEQGDSNHEAYKSRQQQSVRRRLLRGRRGLRGTESPDAAD